MGLIIFSTMSNRLLEYKLITYTVLGIGLVASIFFIKVLKEPELVAVCHERQEHLKKIVAEQKAFDKKLVEGISEASLDSEDEGKITPLKRKESITDWFKMPKFYLFGVCYMAVRMYTNLFGTLLPFYLTDVLDMTSGDDTQVSYAIALVPMLAYAASVVTSTQIGRFYNLFGRKMALFVGTAMCIGCLVFMVFLSAKDSWVMYILAFFIGTPPSTQAPPNPSSSPPASTSSPTW
jgi:Na+/melibiose symporter-like transporter